MIVKCACQNCGVNIEFEAEAAGQIFPCPSCGQLTRLQLPGKTNPNTHSEKVAKVEAKQITPTPQAATIKQIRQQTCYKTLREMIGVVQILFFLAAGLAGFGVTGNFLAQGQVATSIGGKLLAVIIGLVSAFILIVLGIAWKQAALLLVDIADCQIRIVSNKN